MSQLLGVLWLQDLGLTVGFGLVTASVLAVAGVGLSLQFGVTNFVNFAYGDYATLGAYLALVGIEWHITLAGAIAMAGVGVAIFSVLVYRYIFRSFLRTGPRLITMLIVSLGLSLAMQNGIAVIWGAGFQTYGLALGVPLAVGPFSLTPRQIITIIGGVLLLVAIHSLLKYTRIGKAMRAMSDNKDLAEASGISTAAITHLTWLLSGFLVGVAGVVFAINVSTFTPFLGTDFLFLIFAVVILGGIGKIYGAIVAALVIGLATSVLSPYIGSEYEYAAAFLLMITVLLIRPYGIVTAKGKN